MKMLDAIAAAALAGMVLAAGCKKDDEASEPAETEAQASAVPAAAGAFPVEAPDSLRALARITLDSAQVLALSRVPNGRVQKVELEREDGALIWSFDIQVAGQEGISEVRVNALTGAVAPVEHEGPAIEAREARQDSAAVRRPVTGTTRRP